MRRPSERLRRRRAPRPGIAGRTAVVTGGARHIGLAIAGALSEADYRQTDRELRAQAIAILQQIDQLDGAGR